MQVLFYDSCLIARNLLRGCKTCAEVAKYTQELDDAGIDGRRIADSLVLYFLLSVVPLMAGVLCAASSFLSTAQNSNRIIRKLIRKRGKS